MDKSQIEQRLQKLREEYKDAPNERRLIILRQARGLQNALGILEKKHKKVYPQITIEEQLPTFNSK